MAHRYLLASHVFRARLADAIELRKITKSLLAEQIGKDPSTVTKWAKGSIEPNLDDLAALSVHLRKSVDWLLGLNEPQHLAEQREQYELELSELRQAHAASEAGLRELLSKMEKTRKP